jgi:hypothetical protein
VVPLAPVGWPYADAPFELELCGVELAYAK